MNRLGIILFMLLGSSFSSVTYADWASLAVDEESGVWGVAVQRASQKQAETMALSYCSDAGGTRCKIVGSLNKAGYVAIATSKSAVRASVRDTPQEAKRAALDFCAEETSSDDVCTIEWTGTNGLELETRTVNAQDCRPRTRELRCRSSCTNGNCIVEYENGCRMRVQVSPRFDPFSNQWTYPSPSC